MPRLWRAFSLNYGQTWHGPDDIQPWFELNQ